MSSLEKDTSAGKPSGGSDSGRSRRKIAYGEGREVLLAAIARVVARHGVDGVTYRAVAAEAGVTHGLASYYFPNREAMLLEALAWATRHSMETSRMALENGGLEQFAAGVHTMMAEAPEEAVFQFELALESWRRPELSPEVQELYELYFEATRQTLDDIGLRNQPVLARLVFAILDGLSIQQIIFGRPEETEEAIALMRYLLRRLAEDERQRAAKKAAAVADPPAAGDA